MSPIQPTTVLWGLHAGRGGAAVEQCLENDVILFGRSSLGDLSQIAPDREAFRQKALEDRDGRKPKAVQNGADQAYRFAHEMKQGDLVAVPVPKSGVLHVLKVKGEYR